MNKEVHRDLTVRGTNNNLTVRSNTNELYIGLEDDKWIYSKCHTIRLLTL